VEIRSSGEREEMDARSWRRMRLRKTAADEFSRDAYVHKIRISWRWTCRGKKIQISLLSFLYKYTQINTISATRILKMHWV
jgi:hypothetical protein